MKRAISPILSVILSLSLAASLFPAAARAASSAYGSDVWLRDTALQEGVTYSENIFWSGSYDKPRHEYYFTYTPGVGGDLPSAGKERPAGSEWNPGGLDLSWLFPDREPEEDPGPPEEEDGVYTGVRPVASYGSSVCGRSAVTEAARAYESLGYRVVGAVNGDFYDTGTGFPLGILISGGELLSGSSGYYAAGFRADGSAVMGEPRLSITATANGRSLTLASLNKPRVEKAGVSLLTCDFRDDHTAGPSVSKEGVNVAAAVLGGRAAIGEELSLVVTEVAEDSQVRTLERGQVLLTVDAEGYTEGVEFLRSLLPGDTVTVSFSTPDPAWSEVTEAVGAYYLLVEDGRAKDGFEAAAAPRTAVGVKANGEVIFYALDGRQNEVSMGASLGALAERMEELGCVTALCLDGGGSTTAAAALPDSDSARLLNSPSDKSQRKVTNHLLLLAPGEPTGEPAGVYLSAAAPAVLAGHTVALSANVTDSNYFPMDLPLEFYATDGEISDGVFTAPARSGPVTVAAAYGGLYARRDILVVDAPDGMSVLSPGGGSSLTLPAGETAQLSLSAVCNHLPLEVFPEDAVWSADPGLGTVDETGLFTASGQAGTGTVTAVIGGVRAVLPVTVEAGHPFADLEGHWAEPYMSQLYRQGVLTGIAGADGALCACPDKSLSRAEFSVLLARYLELDLTEFEGGGTPFADLESVESWAGGAIRAMYGLGVVNGVDPAHFDPQAPLGRAQAAAMLGRALGLTEPAVPGEPDPEPTVPAEPEDGEPLLPEEPELPPETDGADRIEGQLTALSAPPGDGLSGYPDADEVPDYALEYFRILIAGGALDSRDGLLAPAAPITRAEICKALVVTERMNE